MTETEARIINEFVAGDAVPAIAARYSVSEQYVDELIERTHVDKPLKVRGKRDWSWNHWSNRLVYSLVAGYAVVLLTGFYWLGGIIAVVLFALTTAIITSRR